MRDQEDESYMGPLEIVENCIGSEFGKSWGGQWFWFYNRRIETWEVVGERYREREIEREMLYPYAKEITNSLSCFSRAGSWSEGEVAGSVLFVGNNG